MKRLLLWSLLLSLSISAAHAETIAGRASVIDGDTLEIHGERIRILDIPKAHHSAWLAVRDRQSVALRRSYRAVNEIVLGRPNRDISSP
jgi:endonuclease YncB( thermonuclease family)